MFCAVLVGLSALAQNSAWPASDVDLGPDALSRPELMPGDPDFPPRLDPRLGCLGQAALYSFTPACAAHVAPAERELGSGVAADRAWLLTRGRAEVSIAILDTGADWSDRELVGRWRLNPGELPMPVTGTAAPTRHDRNGDGAFTVLDYTSATGTTAPTLDKVVDLRLLARPDRGDANGNGLLDPGDLIRIFSDGKDSDGNGFVDDICGWDFAGGDNDPGDPGAAHGARFARIAVGEANNGIGGAGVCSRCTAIPVRVATAELARGNLLAQGVVFAADSGARIIAAGVPPLDPAAALAIAADHAQDRGALVIAAAGNRTSPGAAGPWNAGRVLLAGSVSPDAADLASARSVLAPDPCASFGPGLSAAAPGSCDESAAAILAGIAGLVRSAALGISRLRVAALDPPLGPGELFQILAASADRPPALRQAWTATTGYGRANARKALDAVVRRQIAPEVELTSPAWFRLIDPTPGDGFEIRGQVANRRAERASWVLEYAPGLSPRDDAYSPVASGSLALGESSSVTGHVPTTGLFPDPTAVRAELGGGAVTLRLVVSALAGGAVARGESRRVVFVHRDLHLLPIGKRDPGAAPGDFAWDLGAGATPPRVLDGEGLHGIVVGSADGRIHAISGTGTELAGWPVELPLGPSGFRESLFAPASIGVLAAGEAPSVVAATLDGRLVAFGADGAPRAGFPASLGGPVTASPVLVDLDGGGTLEIVVVSGGSVDAYDARGQRVSGFPVALGEGLGAPAVGDADGDGLVDIAVASHRRVFLLHGDGMRHASGPIHAGWPVDLPAASFSAGSATGAPIGAPPGVVLARAIAMGQLDLIVSPAGRSPLVIDALGRVKVTAVPARSAFGIASAVAHSGAPIFALDAEPSVADLTGNGSLDVIAPAGTARFFAGPLLAADVEPLIAAWSLADGGFLSAFPAAAGDRWSAGALIADIDGDKRPEVVFGDGAFRIHAITARGTFPRGWPKLIPGTIAGTPGTGDLDGDGLLEIYATTREGLLLAWRTDAPATGSVPWNGHRHDHRSTGNLETPATVRSGPAHAKSCGCDRAASTGAGSTASAGVVLLALGLRRRKG